MVTLRLLLHGMIAFVLNNPEKPTQLTAYLLDAAWREPDSEQCIRHNHVPFLAYKIQNTNQCEHQDSICAPKVVSDPDNPRLKLLYCICDIDGRLMEFRPLPNMPEHGKWPVPGRLTPTNQTEAQSPAWVPRMDKIYQRDTDARPQSTLRRRTIGEVTFGWTELKTCELANVGDSVSKVPYFMFRPLALSTPKSSHQQAVAEAVMATLEFNSGGPIELVLKKALALTKIITIPCADGACRDLIIANAMRDEGREDERCSDEMKGREFELYSDIADITATHPPLVPHFAGVMEGEFPNIPECPPRFRPLNLANPEDRRLLGAEYHGESSHDHGTSARTSKFAVVRRATSGRPICTMAVF